MATETPSWRSSQTFRTVASEVDFSTLSNANLVLQNQVERLLHSDELRGSEVLRRLLKFLAEKSICGAADDLNEYAVAIDGLGKPASYDPRHNSAVRIQMGRLRQKLADYYRGEGLNDPVFIDLPKGRFKLKCELRDDPAIASSAEPMDLALSSAHPRAKRVREIIKALRFPAAVAAGMLLSFAVGGARNWLKPAKAGAASVANQPSWSADMEDLWRPFISSNRPMIVAIEDPLFVELDGKKGVYYRDKTLNNWKDVTNSHTIEAVRGALKNREIAPSRYYTAFGEVDSSFLLARLLGSHVQNLSVLKTSDLSMRELADNNVVFVGIENIFFTDQIQAAPVAASLQPVRDGIRNIRPGPHEPEIFLDQYSTAPTEEGIAYALVTHVPGPMGGNDVESFTCSRAAGYVAAVKAFTDPSFVRDLVHKLKQASNNQMPRYYQVLLKVKFTAEEPTEITYVLARELHYSARS
jgi:hypothetical protein